MYVKIAAENLIFRVIDPQVYPVEILNLLRVSIGLHGNVGIRQGGLNAKVAVEAPLYLEVQAGSQGSIPLAPGGDSPRQASAAPDRSGGEPVAAAFTASAKRPVRKKRRTIQSSIDPIVIEVFMLINLI